MEMENYGENNELSTISTSSAGYKVGILNSDGDAKLRRGDSNESKYGNSGGESDHRVSGEEEELVNDDRGVDWHGSSTLKKSSHEVGHRSFSVWLGAMQRESTCAFGCSGNPVRVSTGGLTMYERVDWLL